MSTKICTGEARLSYLNVINPRPNEYGDVEYSVTLLIPKSDKATHSAILAAQAEAREAFCRKNGAAALPAKPNTTLHDGDTTKENGDPYPAECRGHWVMAVKTKTGPRIVDLNKQPITDPSVLYSGCYGQAVINFYGYSRNGKKGISAGLLGLRKLRDGDPLSGSVCQDSDFDDTNLPDMSADDDWMR